MNTNNGLYCYVTIEHTDLNFNKNSFKLIKLSEYK